MAVLNKNWDSSSRVSPKEAAVVTGESASDEQAPEETLLPQPLLVYVPAQDNGEFDKAEKVVLMDDKVCIGMWAFKCVKMTNEDAKADPLFEKGEETPRFYVVHRDLSKVKLIEGGDMSAKKLFSAMESAANAAYKQKLEKSVKSMLKVLNEFDKIANERKVMQEKQARNEGELDKKMERDLAELDEREKAAKEEHEELLRFELR
jgi:hypothetical protein